MTFPRCSGTGLDDKALLALKYVAGMPIHNPRSFWQYLKKT